MCFEDLLNDKCVVTLNKLLPNSDKFTYRKLILPNNKTEILDDCIKIIHPKLKTIEYIPFSSIISIKVRS